MSRKWLSVLVFFCLIGWVGIILIHMEMAAPGNKVTMIVDLSSGFLIVLTLCAVLVGLGTQEDGSPLHNIEAGQYDIVFMNATDINLAVVLADKKKGELFYKFPLEAFNGEISPKAKVLEVVVSGNRGQFKKLHLVSRELESPVSY